MSGAATKRMRDAAAAQAAILAAAEQAFAEHGFAGARIDAIAKRSGYNSSLLFHYFGDKLGLYAAVVKQADREMTALQARLLAPLLADEALSTSARAFRAALEQLAGAFFDYLLEHPRFLRMLLWEQAQGWQTFARIAAEVPVEDGEQLQRFFGRARSAGLLRSDFEPLIQLTMMLQLCLSYLSFVPAYRLALPPDTDLGSAGALARAREYLVGFIVNGMLVDLPATQPPHNER